LLAGTVPTQGQAAAAAGDDNRARAGTAGRRAGSSASRARATDTALRVYNGRDQYNEWVFVAQQASA
jgi:hypothetical protein